MDRMLVVVFENEKQAYEGHRALQQLDVEGTIVVYAAAVISKNGDGTAAVKQGEDFGPWGTLTGTAVGSLIGLLGGPIGLALGAASGALVGSIPDLENARVGSDFLDDVGKTLVAGKTAVVTEIDEEWTTPVDARMEALGGFVHRRSLAEVVDTMDERDIATMKADVAQLKAEHAEAKAERKAALQARIDALNVKIQKKLETAKARRESVRKEAQAKVDALKSKATNAKQEIKAKQEQRLANVKKQYTEWLNRLESAQ